MERPPSQSNYTARRATSIEEPPGQTSRFSFGTCIRPIGGDYQASIQNPHGVLAENMGKQRLPHGNRGTLVRKNVWSAQEPVRVKVLQLEELVIDLKPGTCFTR